MKRFAVLVFCLAAMSGWAVAEEAADSADAVDAPKEVTISTFYEALTPYGKWVQDADLGWVWQPNEVVVDVEWRPYCHGGHWVWTNTGWYWASDYKWGWAAFHYGRWSRHATLGWVWTPDCTWGPAWVSWRDCETHFGWAPLPPACEFEAGVGFSFRSKHVAFGFEFGLGVEDYYFCPAGAILEINLWHHHCHHEECVKVYNKCVVHNTIIVRNKVIIHEGCGREIVEKRCNKRIVETKIHSERIVAGHAIHGERVARDGIHVYRPEVKKEIKTDPNAARAHHEERKHEIEQRHEQIKQHQEQRHEMNKGPALPHHEAAPRQEIPRGRSEVVPHHEAPPVHHEVAPQHHQATPPPPPAHHKKSDFDTED